MAIEDGISKKKAPDTLEDSDISVRLYNYLKNNKIGSLNDLAGKTDAELAKIVPIEKTLQELQNILVYYGVRPNEWNLPS